MMTTRGPVKRFRKFNDNSPSSPIISSADDQLESVFNEMTHADPHFPGGIHCTDCGNPNQAGYRYCCYCGSNLVKDINKTQNMPSKAAGFDREPFFQKDKTASSGSKERKNHWTPWILVSVFGIALLVGTVMIASPLFNQDHSTTQITGNTARLRHTAVQVNSSNEPDSTTPAPGAANQPAILVPTATKPASTNTPTAPLASATPDSCPGAPRQRLEVGEDARVCTKSDNVFLRSGPAKSHSVIARVPPGSLVEVLEGPRCSDDWSWWQVKVPGGTIGWMSEGGDRIDPYFLCPTN